MQTEIQNISDKIALSIEEAAHVAGIGRTFLYELSKQPDGITFRKIGKRSVVLRSELESWLSRLPKKLSA
jgi:predicted DNA-binding transcriptional regulator AlpA